MARAKNRGGRPAADLTTLRSIREIARREGVSVPTIERDLRRGTETLRALDAYEGLILLAKDALCGPDPIIRCGSVECRSEWISKFAER